MRVIAAALYDVVQGFVYAGYISAYHKQKIELGVPIWEPKLSLLGTGTPLSSREP